MLTMPSSSKNLLSFKCFYSDNNISTQLDSQSMKVVDKELEKTLMDRPTDGGLYRLSIDLKGGDDDEVFLLETTSYKT